LVVRLKRSTWHDSNGMYQKISIMRLKRKSNRFDFLNEECNMIGANETFPRIINLNECKDGIYQIVICNEHRDWETGIIDDYDFQLIPYTK
jgi:hypothetical protein